MPTLRARTARTTFGGLVSALRRYRERDTGPISGEASPELFEAGAIEVRRALELLTRASLPLPGVTEREAAGAPVPSWWYEPEKPTGGRTVLYLHGGAYVAGSHGTHRALASVFARVARADVFLPEYRLAPEHRFPAAVEDAVASYRWLLEQGRRPEAMAFAGDSAGGGLALAVALAALDEGLPMPAGLALMSPWTDLTGSGASVRERDQHDIWLDGALIAPAGRMYAPVDPLHRYASPRFADLTGLPPMLVHVGGDEVLLDDARGLVAQARSHGVEASVGEFEGMWHVFQAIPGIPEGRHSLRELGAFVRRVTAAGVVAAA